MEIKTSYIVNENGNKEFVVIPYQYWKDIQKLIRKYEILEEIRESFLEVKNSKQLGKPMKSLAEVLNEC